MLMAQEMLKEADIKQKGPSVVARLMGLDSYLPAQQPDLNTGRNMVRTHGGSHQQDNGSFNKAGPFDLQRGYRKEMDLNDVYISSQKPSGAKVSKDPYKSNESYIENQTERRMALVRQNFIEAKRLATDQKLLQSKEFQDALEVLSSNRDLFLKFLEEPNSLFSKQINDTNAIPTSPQTRNITILKPSKTVELKNERLVTEQHEMDGEMGWAKNMHSRSFSFSHSKSEDLLHPTRIVVLKPTVEVHSMKPQVNPTVSYSENLKQNECDGCFGDIDALGSRVMSNSTARDESSFSSVNSNKYVGSSFSRSEEEYTEDDGSYIDSGTVTPPSRRLWDSANKHCSPISASASSISRISSTPESSVTKEAKKRLSERWALVVANGISQEQMHLQRSSSTLGEMLALREVKKEECHDDKIPAISRSCGGENEFLPVSCLPIGRAKDAGAENSPQSLSRSRSVPISCTTYEKLDLNNECSKFELSKTTVSIEMPKTRKGKSSLKGKFSSFFFSRSRKSSEQRPVSPTLPGSEVAAIQSSGDAVSDTGRNNELTKPFDANMEVEENHGEEHAVFSIDETRAPSNFDDTEMHGSFGSLNYKLDETSPTSVLDALPGYDGNEHAFHSSEADSERQCALSRALPIASVTRTFSWEAEHLNVLSPEQPKSCTLPKENGSIKEQFAWVAKLLSPAGIDKSRMIFTGWHSLDSPLDPMLLEELMKLEDGEKCTKRRLNQRLLFDCVNSALLETSRNFFSACPWNRASFGPMKGSHVDAAASRELWNLLEDWFLENETHVPSETNTSVAIGSVLRQEVEGLGWTRSMKLEVEDISKEISCEILKQFVDETLADFAAAD